jgi:hypothetical protein
VCRFDRAAVTDVPHPTSGDNNGTTRFDLAQAQFYLLLASGPLDAASGHLVKHSSVQKSASPQVHREGFTRELFLIF